MARRNPSPTETVEPDDPPDAGGDLLAKADLTDEDLLKIVADTIQGRTGDGGGGLAVPPRDRLNAAFRVLNARERTANVAKDGSPEEEETIDDIIHEINSILANKRMRRFVGRVLETLNAGEGK